MDAYAPLAAADKSDPQMVKQWAAEDFAINIGLLRECPYHGQPFKAQPKGFTRRALAASVIDPLDPNVKIFNGNTRELLAAAERVAGKYGERCAFCAASELDDFE